ncbi:hypothetical protein [Roseovarius sp.]|uniref:hypothetical protein n=1 Tax=Roseovarius sp. TaxID=1486281 RepID=UPI0035655551
MEKPELRHPERRSQAVVHRIEAAIKPHHFTGSHRETEVNGDEARLGGEGFPSNFTKGLLHEPNGIVKHGYPEFRDAINKINPKHGAVVDFSKIPTGSGNFVSRNQSNESPTWRGWESPRTGHYFDLQGPDPDAVGMAPAPELGSAELTAEMAEVYAMALLRDVPFSLIEQNDGADPETGISTQEVLAALNAISYFAAPVGDTFAKRRLAGRLLDPDKYDIKDGKPKYPLPSLTGTNLFRGSGPGAKAGPWVSQLMLLGNAAGDYAHTDGFIAYGSQFIDQRSRVFVTGLDYMTNWNEWRDVQNGADKRGAHKFESGTRFLTTPRDMATYVRFDALYQAYLNACLVLLSQLNPKFGFQPGFPDRIDKMDTGDEFARTGFAAFGGPHILSLVTEVATRCLKFARRQKFNWHRRARPEKISGLLTLAALAGVENVPTLGKTTQSDSEEMVDQLGHLTKLIHKHNQDREAKNKRKRTFTAEQERWLANSDEGKNLLLAMAFPEGSPMHPAYAAGHATVAGGCVTMLKAFFKTLDETNKPLTWDVTELPIVEADPNGAGLTLVQDARAKGLTLEGELNKLAANISIARNMAGVHYYSDYYDSLRMGERVAVGILVEQMRSYDELVEIVFRSFDGDLIKINSTTPDAATIIGVNGTQVDYRDWMQRPQTS